MLKLFVKNNWLNEETYTIYTGQILKFPSHLMFRLEWTDERVTSIHVGDQLLYLAADGEHSFTFPLTHVAELTELRIRYQNNEGMQNQLYQIHFDLGLYPAESLLIHTIKRPLFDLLSEWASIAREEGEDSIEFDASLMEERSEHLTKSLDEFLKQIAEQDDYLFFRERRQILVLIEQVIRQPKKKLIDREQLVHSSEATVISPRTVQHFMQDTSTWSGISFGKPRPNQLLQTYQEESLNVYENRFVVTFIRLVIQQIQPLKLKMKQMYENTVSNEQDLLFREKEGLLDVNEKHKLEQIQGDKERLHILLAEVKSYEAQLKKQLDFFKEIKEISGYVKPNQVLQQNKFYGNLYKLYKHFRNDAGSLASKTPDSIDYLSYYNDFIYLDLIRLLRQLQFYPENGTVRLPINPDADSYFLTSDEMKHAFQASDGSPFQITISRSALTKRDREIARILVVLTNIETNEVKQIQILPTLTSFKSYFSKDTIRYLYSREDEVDSTYILYPMETNDDYHQMPYELAQYVYTIGSKFIDAEDLDNFGNFKYGMFQYSTHQQLSYDLLQRILKVALFQIGHHHRCLICNATGKPTHVNNTKFSYICSNSNCKLEWGSSTCSCGGEMLKMKAPLSKVKGEERQEERLRNMKAIEWIIMNESKNAKNSLAGLCENALRNGGFFVICPTCGNCPKSEGKSRICKYCEAKERIKGLH